MKIAIVHDWLVTYAGAERVLEQILKIFPDADIYSVVDFIAPEERGFLLNKSTHNTFIQKLPFAKSKYRHYLPLMPLAIEQLDLSAYDLVISSSHAVAKGILIGPDQLHISYVHSPIRYAWDLQHQYLRESGLDKGIKSWIAKICLHYMRLWDLRTANGVDCFIANSNFIARRIWKVYRREATVISPPVNVQVFSICEKKEDFYVTASRMVPYKRIDLIVKAFTQMPDKKLIVIGDGPDYKKISNNAGRNIEFLGYQPLAVMKDYMQRGKAFVFAAEEDFGITLVEAQACGTPVIAFGKGGALDIVRPIGQDNPTGIFFETQTIDSIVKAVTVFEKEQALFRPIACRENALRFSNERFNQEFKKIVNEKVEFFRKSRSL